MAMKMLVPTLVMLSIIAGCLHSNAQKLDSLKSELEVARGIARCSILSQIAYELVDVDDGAAVGYAKESVQCATMSGDTLMMIRASRIKGMAFGRLDERDSAFSTYLSVIPIARRKMYNDELHYLVHGIAVELSYRGQYDEALRFDFEALEIRRKIASPTYVASTLNNIGVIYYKLRNYYKAAEYFRCALEQIAKEPGGGKQEETTLANLSLCYAYRGELDKADSLTDAAERHCNGNCLQIDLINIPFCRGVVALNRLDTIKAKIEFLESYKRAREFNNERLELDNIVYLSQICLETNKISEASYYLGKAEELIKKGVSYNMELMKVYKEFANLYEKKGDYRRVAEFQRRYIAYRDSTQNEEMTIGLMQIETKHVEEQKNGEIEVQARMLDLNKKIIFRQRIATILAFSTIALLLGYVVLLVRSVREKKNRNIDLEKRVKSRTVELESIVNQSQRSLSEKKLWIEKIVLCVRHTVNTVNGLRVLVNKDPDSREACSRLIEQEMTHLLSEVNAYASKSDSGMNGVRSGIIVVVTWLVFTAIIS